MLILTRHPGQNICIFLEDGREIQVSILEVIDQEFDYTVRVGIEAPKTITILREELVGQKSYDQCA